MRKTDLLKEYVRRLNEDDLKTIGSKLSQRLGGDVGEAVEKIQENPDMDRWLASAINATEFFDMLDQVDNYIQQEQRKRFGNYESKEKAKQEYKR